MMTVTDIEKKEKCIKICDNLYENGHIFKIKDRDRNDDDYPYINILVKSNLITADELLKLFKEKGFEGFKSHNGYYVILSFHKEVENLTIEECFEI